MKENYIVINGKKIELTEEQIKALNLDIELRRRNPFKRVNDEYYCIEKTGNICWYSDTKDQIDIILYNNVNYFNDEAFAKQVSLRQLLYRKLLKFAYDNECEDMAEWNGSTKHWYIYRNFNKNNYDVFVSFMSKYECACGFSSEEGAKRAIKEVIEPFEKEHPDFVW